MKKAVASKTLWVNGLSIAAAILAWMALPCMLALAVFVLMACGYFNQAWNPSGESVCDDPAVVEESLICQLHLEAGTVPEVSQGILLDAASTAVIFEWAERQELCMALYRIKQYYTPGFYWAMLVGMIENEAEKSEQFANILQRRSPVPLEEYAQLVPISNFDDGLLREAWTQHSENLRCSEFYPLE